MVITWQTIITAGAVLAAVLAIGGVIFKVYKWILCQEKQTEQIAELKKLHNADVKCINEENTLICYALSACLDGLMQLGANHNVPIAKEKLDKYLNQQAHK
jgi:hypothetical protein